MNENIELILNNSNAEIFPYQDKIEMDAQEVIQNAKIAYRYWPIFHENGWERVQNYFKIDIGIEHYAWIEKRNILRIEVLETTGLMGKEVMFDGEAGLRDALLNFHSDLGPVIRI